MFRNELVLVTEEERCRRASASCLLKVLFTLRNALSADGVTFVMRLARSGVVFEVLLTALELFLSALLRPKISLASASFFFRCRSE